MVVLLMLCKQLRWLLGRRLLLLLLLLVVLLLLVGEMVGLPSAFLVAGVPCAY